MIIIEIQVCGDRWEHEMPRDIAEGLCGCRELMVFRGKSLSYLISRLPEDIRAQIKSTKIEPLAPTPDTHGIWIDEIVLKEEVELILSLRK